MLLLFNINNGEDVISPSFLDIHYIDILQLIIYRFSCDKFDNLYSDLIWSAKEQSILLKGNNNMTLEENNLLFDAVQQYMNKSKRF